MSFVHDSKTILELLSDTSGDQESDELTAKDNSNDSSNDAARSTFELRNQLLAERSKLKGEVEQLRLQKMELDIQAEKRRLSRSESERKRERHNEDENFEISSRLEQILQSSTALPSLDIPLRELYLKLLCSQIRIEDSSDTPVESNPNNRTITYTVHGFGPETGDIFKCAVQVDINQINGEDIVEQISLPNKSQPVIISILSPIYYRVLIKNYLPNRKLNLLMYSLNSLAELVELRYVGLQSISEKPVGVTTSSVNVRINPTTLIDIGWQLVLEDSITGELQSVVSAYINGTRDVSEALQLLLSECTISEAVEVLRKELEL